MNKLSNQLVLKILRKRLEELANRQSYIYDADKANYYKNLLDIYNYNAFGYGLEGTPTKFNPNTTAGLLAIASTYDYSKGKAIDFLADVSGVGVGAGVSLAANKVYSKFTKGIFKSPSKNGALGTLKQYTKNPIGEGGEAIVVNNTPTSVGKMTSIPVEEMATRNRVPHTVSTKYVGYVKDNGIKLPTYILQKVKVLSEKTFPKYIGKLDKAMERSGFTRVNDPNVLYRAYTNGLIVVDDLSPDNVGLTIGNPILDFITPDFLKNLKIIDMGYLTVPEWLELGYKLKNGGKFTK